MERGVAYRALVGLALIVGTVCGIALFHSDQPHYSFLHGEQPIRVAELRTHGVAGTLRIYNVHLDWRVLASQIEQDSPLSLHKTGVYHGLPAESVVVPRLESGRAKLFESPIREITVVQGRFFRDKAGMEIVRPSDGGWAGVRVVEFRQPRFLDTAGEWLRDRLRI